MFRMPDYECDNCGACCRTFPVFASLQDAEREARIVSESRRLPDNLVTPDWTFQLFPLPFHETCCFLDAGNLCTIYSSRPSVCRAFAAGSEQCQEARGRSGLEPLAEAATRIVALADDPFLGLSTETH
jgi:uncharacterized protein